MKRLTLFAITSMLAFAVGCGHDDTEPLSHKLDELDMELDHLDELATSHDGTVQAATTLAQVAGLEQEYGPDASGHYQSMDHMAEEMATCDNGGINPDMTAMDTALDALREELAAHQVAMAQAADVSAAKSEETRHQGALDQIFSELHAAENTLAADGDSFACEGHHH